MNEEEDIVDLHVYDEGVSLMKLPLTDSTFVDCSFVIVHTAYVIPQCCTCVETHWTEAALELLLFFGCRLTNGFVLR